MEPTTKLRSPEGAGILQPRTQVLGKLENEGVPEERQKRNGTEDLGRHGFTGCGKSLKACCTVVERRFSAA